MTALRQQKPPTKAAYERDLYSWAMQQAALVEGKRFGDLDTANIAEELRSLGRSEYRALESALTIVLQHLLKWDHQPDRRSRSWALSITEHRGRAESELTDSPGLKAKRAEALAGGYRTARLRAASETGLPLSTFPEVCPYSWEATMERSIPVDP